MIDRIYKLYCYWRLYGSAAVIKLIRGRLGYQTRAVIDESGVPRTTSSKPVGTADILRARFDQLTPVRTYTLSDTQARRINMLTDSIGSGSLFGGVGTALIFAALFSNKLDIPLRIITRTERPKPENIDKILSLYGIKLRHEVQFKFAAFYDEKYELDVFARDLFITTSWWTTAALLPGVAVDKIIYLLQEDERKFYPFGEDRLRCEAILRNPDICFVVNTKLLFDHLVNDGFDKIASNGQWFEPSFPPEVFSPKKKEPDSKHKFFFYARPNNPRNLFYLGIEIIEKAIVQNILDLEHWDIYLVGKNIPSITFDGGYSPIKCEDLGWAEYAQLVGTVDLGLSLMYTPHPSYPPLDLVASGAVVVTNRYANKRDLSAYSKNLICADLERDALVSALSQAAQLALDTPRREQNFRDNTLLINWSESFDQLIQKISEDF